MTRVIFSTEDNSVNFIDKANIGFFESRYVKRETSDYFIAYLSVQSGCDLGCKFCHLTTTKQSKFIENTIDDLLLQAKDVLEHYSELISQDKEKPVKYMHYNFMARGEVFNSPIFQNEESAQRLLSELTKLSYRYGLEARFLLSTIMPESFIDYDLNAIFTEIKPFIYYSIYSTNPSFRKKWLPKAMDTHNALTKLSDYNNSRLCDHNLVKIHYAFIENQNDSVADVTDVCDLLLAHKMPVDFNIVRYNPYSEKQGRESSETIIFRNADVIRNKLNTHVKVIPRVGKDVKASCGMFINK